MTREEFGAWVKDLRIECGYTQARLAKLLGFNNGQSIANIESGRVPLPKRNYRQFIKVFNLDPKKFIDVICKIYRKDLEEEIYHRTAS